MAATHVFIDTNVVLHYKRPNEIDWLILTGADEVVLVAAPVLLTELEIQKVHNTSRKLKNRAHEFVRWLAEFVRDPSRTVRPGVRWHFIGEEPIIDYLAAGLVREIDDDRLIASVLTYKPDDGGRICVATGDIGLEAKLRRRKIDLLVLDEDLLLPSEPDPLEKKVRDLQQQLAQQRAPQLALTWDGGAAHWTIAIPPECIVPPATSLAEIIREVPLLPTRAEVDAEQQSPMARFVRPTLMLQIGLMSNEAIERFNNEVRAYRIEYEAYLAKLLEWQETQSLTVPLRLLLSNQGDAPASQVGVELIFPSDIQLLVEEDLLPRPKQPDKPRKPMTSVAQMLFPEESWPRPLQNDWALLHPAPSTIGGPKVDNKTHRVRFDFMSLKHEEDVTLDGICFRFLGRSAVRSFEVKYRLSAAQVPKSIRSSLHIVVDSVTPAS